jgi:hypothetical protein
VVHFRSSAFVYVLFEERDLYWYARGYWKYAISQSKPFASGAKPSLGPPPGLAGFATCPGRPHGLNDLARCARPGLPEVRLKTLANVAEGGDGGMVVSSA